MFNYIVFLAFLLTEKTFMVYLDLTQKNMNMKKLFYSVFSFVIWMVPLILTIIITAPLYLFLWVFSPRQVRLSYFLLRQK